MPGRNGLDPHFERARINFSWILKLRWAGVAGQLLTVLVVHFWLEVLLPLGALAIILLVEAGSNAMLEAWFRSRLRQKIWPHYAQRSEDFLGLVMTGDILLLSGLLYFTGGPSNPFSIFYLVNIVLAAVVLPWRWAWWVDTVAILGYTVLFFWHRVLPPLEAWRLDTDAYSGAESVRIYVRGLLVAFSAAAFFVVYFVTRVTGELNRRERELSDERQRIARTERLEALATVAAGAAHELASPLSTIAVIAKELEIELVRLEVDEVVLGDAHLIRDEVARCRSILDQMSVDAGESRVERMAFHSVGDLLESAIDGLREADRVDTAVEEPAAAESLFVARRTLGLAFRGPIKNALDASPPTTRVLVRARLEDDALVVTVRDRGTGMTPEILERASDPFFTTKEPGEGMGLGLFLSRSVIERLGGSLEFESARGEGTEATVRLPLDRLRQES